MTASLGKMPTTFVLLLISAFNLSRGLVLQIWLRYAGGKDMNTRTSFSTWSIKVPSLGESAAQLIGHGPPLRSGRFGQVLRERRADGRADHATLSLAGVRQFVARELRRCRLPSRRARSMPWWKCSSRNPQDQGASVAAQLYPNSRWPPLSGWTTRLRGKPQRSGWATPLPRTSTQMLSPEPRHQACHCLQSCAGEVGYADPVGGVHRRRTLAADNCRRRQEPSSEQDS
jgi:hypothetical protein